jgi:xanthine/uracil/vitamin C permease (AzgA family)
MPNLVGMVPVIAAGGALLFVGLTLMPSKKELVSYTRVEKLSIVAMAVTVLLTFALDKAMLVGFGTYVIGSVLSGKSKSVDKYLIASTILLAIAIGFQYL